MSKKIKNLLYLLMLIVGVVVVWLRDDASTSQPREFAHLFGNTMGTTYSIKLDLSIDGLQQEVDSVLRDFNQSLSTYINDSEISQFNTGSIFKMELPYLYPVLKRSKEIYQITDGAFDPTVMPLVNAWGFGPDKSDQPDSLEVERLRALVGMDSIFFDSVALCKLKDGIQLDFNAVAKGYGVDVVFDYLLNRGAENVMVEIGGETRAVGVNESKNPWQIGIENPTNNTSSREVMAVVSLNNKALATSGNYRNFYVKDGKKYAHTINPKTGYPVEHSLLSASVLADDCMTADAYATAFMVMGMELAIELVEREDEIEAFLIYSDEDGKLTTYKSPKMKMGG